MVIIDVDNKQIQDELNKLKEKFDDLSPLMLTLSESMLFAIQENFKSEGTRLPAEDQWPELSAWTISERTSKGYWPGKKLHQTGDLIGSMHSEYDKNTAKAGTNKDYAEINNFGGINDKGFSVPARPFAQLIDEDLDGMMQDIMDYLGS